MNLRECGKDTYACAVEVGDHILARAAAPEEFLALGTASENRQDHEGPEGRH